MTLAAMVSIYENEFICDMAETYHVFDYEALPVDLLVVLACGLRDNSRTKLKISGVKHIPLELVIPQIFDQILLLRCGLSGQKKVPTLMTEFMTQEDKPSESVSFKSGSDFMDQWNRLAGEKNG